VTPADAAVRSPLTRDRVAHAALARIDADGLEALSMRKLGADLGVEAMSLYNHVRNKDDLLDLVGELLTAKVLERFRETATGDWRERSRAMARAWWEVGRAHPQAFSLIAERPASGPAGIEMLAECMRLFTDAGFALDKAVQAFQTAAAWVIGVVTQEIHMMARLSDGQGFADHEVPPELSTLLDFKRVCVGTPADDRFAVGVEVLLAGIEAQLAPPAAPLRPPPSGESL
jgi:TetR/AcrR family tetracycline transcriptional repressor